MKIFKNSVPTASVFPIRKGNVLLAIRAIEPKRGAYDAIGGFLENGEHPEDGVKREVKEETNLDIRLTGLLGIYMDEYEYQGRISKTLNFAYIAEILGGRIRAQEDVESLRWFPITKPPKNLAFKWLVPALKDLQKWYGKKRKRSRGRR